MGYARRCKCDHNATDHRPLNRNKTKWAECLWHDCECKQYVFGRLHSPNTDTRSYIEQLETLIDCCNVPSYYRKEKTPNLLIKECKPDGRHPEFKHVFNNGEYI